MKRIHRIRQSHQCQYITDGMSRYRLSLLFTTCTVSSYNSRASCF